MSISFTTKGSFPGRSVSALTLGRFKGYGQIVIIAIKKFVSKIKHKYFMSKEVI